MRTKKSPSFRSTLHAWLVLPHAVPIVFVLLATAAFAFIVTGGNPGAAPLASLLIAMLGGQLAVGATNEIVDIELDRVTKPHKPLVSGLVSTRGAYCMVAVGLMLMVIGSMRFSILAGILCALGTGIGIAYSFWFKRTMWSWLPYVLAIPLLPIWVWVALGDPPAAVLLLYPIAIPALVAVHIAQSIADIEGDRAAGIRSLTVQLGSQGARVACWLLTIASVSLAMLSSLLVAPDPKWCLVTGAAAIAVVGVKMWAWHDNPTIGERTVFPLIAMAVVLTGVGWTVSALA